MTAPLRVAVLGAGTVGREVVRALVEWPDRLAEAAGGTRFELAGIAVRDLEAAAARGLPADLLSDGPAHLVASPDTDVIVELMGGEDPARTLIAAALSAGKAVVTANKHVVAHHGPDLEAIARANGAPLRFEAAVGGGIPVLGPLAGDLAANRVRRVRGIVNGTTNYILSAMAEGRGTYEAVLREAQEQGYAEADPSGDVNGGDAINKLVILARLAFDAWLDPALVPDRPVRLRGPGGPGITGVTSAELEAAAALGLTIRLLALAERRPEGGRPTASVVPTAVPLDSPLGRTAGVRNRVEVVAEPVGELGFDGPGAGGPATSSAVLGDLVAVARGLGSTWGGRPAATESRTIASEDVDRARGWFALLPGVRAGKVVAGVAEAHHETDAGVAIRTAPIAAAELTAQLLEAVPESLDATLYPIDA